MSRHYFVNMTDRFMSGWGYARGGNSYLCVKCDTWAQAEAIMRAAQDRSEMKFISIGTKPRKRAGSHTSIKAFSEMGGPWLSYWKAD